MNETTKNMNDQCLESYQTCTNLTKNYQDHPFVYWERLLSWPAKKFQLTTCNGIGGRGPLWPVGSFDNIKHIRLHDRVKRNNIFHPYSRIGTVISLQYKDEDGYWYIRPIVLFLDQDGNEVLLLVDPKELIVLEFED